MIVLYLFKLFFHKKTVSSPNSNENKTAVVSETAVTHLKNSEEHDEFETAAVISAAISAYLDERNLNVSKYRIKSFKII